MTGLFLTGEIAAESSVERRLREIEATRILSTLSPLEALKWYQQTGGNNPSKEWADEATSHLARNAALRDWLPVYFTETPVLFENMKERSGIIQIIRRLPAEWAVRFLVELSLDDRPMKSTKYDYDDPDFVRMIEAHMEALGDSNDAGDLMQRLYGYKVEGNNRMLALKGLNLMELAGVPEMEVQRDKGISVATWLRRPQQRERIPEIVRETWGERAVLNAEIGLGPDNKPLISTGLAPPSTRPRNTGSVAADEAGLAVEASGGPAPSTWIPLVLASGLLVLAIAAVASKRINRRENL